MCQIYKCRNRAPPPPANQQVRLRVHLRSFLAAPLQLKLIQDSNSNNNFFGVGFGVEQNYVDINALIIDADDPLVIVAVCFVSKTCTYYYRLVLFLELCHVLFDGVCTDSKPAYSHYFWPKQPCSKSDIFCVASTIKKKIKKNMTFRKYFYRFCRTTEREVLMCS